MIKNELVFTETKQVNQSIQLMSHGSGGVPVLLRFSLFTLGRGLRSFPVSRVGQERLRKCKSKQKIRIRFHAENNSTGCAWLREAKWSAHIHVVFTLSSLELGQQPQREEHKLKLGCTLVTLGCTSQQTGSHYATK